MRKFAALISLAVVMMFFAATNAMAYLYLPDVEFNSIGRANYDGGTGNLSITALTHYLTFDGLNTYMFNPSFSVSGTSFNAHFDSISGKKWYFESAGVTQPDITIKGTPVVFDGQPALPFTPTGTLLTGNIISLVLDTAINRIIGKFNITGGDLLPYYDYADNIGMFVMNLEFPSGTVRPSNSGTSWNATGLKGDISPSPVPEPATLLMLGSGLLGLAGLARKKINR